MSTTNLVDGNSSTVAAGIAAANPGDTLVIPAGSWVWNSPITIAKSLTLRGVSTPAPASPGKGPGNSSTVITRGGSLAGTNSLIGIQPPSDVPVRVTGLFLDNGLGSTTPSQNYPSIQIIGPDGSNPALKQIRIDNCYFNTGSQVVWWLGGAYGLVDHCYFNNIWINLIYWGGAGDQGDSAWGRNDWQAGSLNFPFAEDCIFRWALSGNPGSPWVLYHQGGGRSVFRHNLVDATQAPNGITGPLDAHGNQNYWKTVTPPQNQRSTIRTEFYANTCNLQGNVYQIMDLRGGSHLVHDNTFTTRDGSTPNIVDCRDEEDDPNNTGGIPVRSPVTWPCEDQVTATFVYNNTLNGAPVNTIGIGTFGNPSATVGDPFYIKLNREVWQKPPDGTTTTVYPAPASPSSASYPNPLNALQLTSYTPAPYPHPMNIPESGGTTGGGGGGTGASMGNPPFLPVSFVQLPPSLLGGGGATPYSGPREDKLRVFPAYNGQSQQKTINQMWRP